MLKSPAHGHPNSHATCRNENETNTYSRVPIPILTLVSKFLEAMTHPVVKPGSKIQLIHLTLLYQHQHDQQHLAKKGEEKRREEGGRRVEGEALLL